MDFNTFCTFAAVFLVGLAVTLLAWGKFKFPSFSQPSVIISSVPRIDDTDAEARKHFLALMECYLRAGDKAKAAALSAIETSPIGDKV